MDLPRIILVDMNSFFASVEQQANPFLRGRPVGVCASLHETSCIIGSSKEAKAIGIKTGTLIYKAKKICPKIILLQAEPEKYREVNRRIVKIFCDYTDRVEVYSIDEAFLDLSGFTFDGNEARIGKRNTLDVPKNIYRKTKRASIPNNVLLIAIEIKQRIKQEVGEWLTCSAGIASNKFMAKLAVDMQKPDGLSIIWRENLPEIYKYKKLRDLWGVSFGWEARLAKIGITSPLQLLEYPHPSSMGEARPKGAAVQNLISLFGKPGYYLWQRVNGYEVDFISNYPSPSRGGWREAPGEVVAPSLSPAVTSPPEGENYTVENQAPKSFGHSWVLNFRTTDKERLKPVILRLAEKAARRMRKQNFQAYGFYLSIRMVDGSFIAKSKKLKFTINTGMELYEQALILWKDWEFHTTDVMHIAVGFRELVEYSRQLELRYTFNGDEARIGKRSTLNVPKDLNRKTIRASIPNNDQRLTSYLDHLNNKYGEFTIRSGLLAKTSDYAPDAIAFGK